MDTVLAEYEKTRAQLITWFGKIFIFRIYDIILFLFLIESVKETQRVTLDEIPMPELPSGSSSSGDISGLPLGFHDVPRSILKQKE
jgi:hypothetical protein